LHSGVTAPRGDPESPWSDDEFAAKYRWLASGLLESGRTEAILAAARGIAELPDARVLLDLLAGPLAG
jgi:hypothetical protein